MSTLKPAKPVLHIIRLSITNFGIIKAAAIHPDGSPVVLAGDNAQGKSTVLASIESVLFGRKLAAPVTTGQDKAQIKLELAEPGGTKAIYRIEQIIRNDEDGVPNYNLKIMDAEGKQVPSPVKFIESLIQSGAALDPTEIMQAKPGERPETFAKRQAEILMERMGLSAKAKKLDAEIEAKATERKLAKQAAEALQSRLDAIEVPPGTPDTPVDVADLSAKIGTYQQLQNEREKQAEKKQQAEERRERAFKAHQEALAAADRAQTALDKAAEELNAIRETVEEFDEINPPAGIAASLADAQAKMANANAINAAVLRKKDRKTISAELATAEAEASSLNSELEKVREARLDLVRKVKLPIEGLKLTADALLFNGQPLVQESTGNQIRVCSQLAMAEEPECRVLFLREGALMNSKNRQIVYDVAAERGWSVWEERFSETPVAGALWVEAGRVTEPEA